MSDSCVVKILGQSATSFAACFYNEQKVAQGTAKCVSMRNFGDLEKYFIHSPVVMSNYLQKIADHNSLVKHPQKHIVFSFPGKATPEEAEQLLKDAAETLDRLGYRGQPQVFWVHNDTDNTHIHAASVTVSVENGMWIDNWKEGRRARRILDQLRGFNVDNAIDKILDYKFENREQFKSLLIASGYKPHYDVQSKTFDIWRNKDLIGSVSEEEVDSRIALTGKNKDNHADLVKNLRGILLDRRRRSLTLTFDDNDSVRVKTKAGREHTSTKKLKEVTNNRFNGEKGLDIAGKRKAQFKQFLLELKQELGISIVFSQWKDGHTKGYTLIDHKNQLVFKGSDIVDLQKLLNPEWRKGQEKDTVLSADAAAAMADEIRQSENLPQAVERQLDRLGIDIMYNEDVAMILYSGDGEEENRRKAKALMKLLVTKIHNDEDATEDGMLEIRTIAKEAMERAFCADKLRIQKEESRALAGILYGSHPTELDKARQRIEAAKKITADKIGEFVVDFLDDFNIEYSPYDNYEEGKFNMQEGEAIRSALEKLQKAVEAKDPGVRSRLANEAIYFAKGAEELHREASREPEEQKKADVIPFVKVSAWFTKNRDGSVMMGVFVNGEKYLPKLLERKHFEWFLQQTNREQATQDLLIHYFGDEIQQAQIEKWKQLHFDAGKMPFGIRIGKVYGFEGKQLDHFWLGAEYTMDGKTKRYSKEVSREDYVKFDKYLKNENEEQARVLVYNAVGRDLIKTIAGHLNILPISEIKETLFGSPKAFETVEGLEQSVEAFERFTEQLCYDFSRSCGAAAAAYFNSILPNGGDGRGMPGGGGGSNDTGGWGGKKDDDEWWKRGPGIIGFNRSRRPKR